MDPTEFVQRASNLARKIVDSLPPELSAALGDLLARGEYHPVGVLEGPISSNTLPSDESSLYSQAVDRIADVLASQRPHRNQRG
jgi:hypothetical protein